MHTETRTRRAAGPLLCPFTIVVDTREQKPYTFSAITADAAQGRRPVQVPTHGAALLAGDYSIQGMEQVIAVERKSKADLFSTLGQGRQRFARELDLLQCMWFAAVVVEAEWSEVVSRPPAYSSLKPVTISRSVMAWQVRKPVVHWWFVPGREAAEQVTYRLLERFWKERQV